MASAVACWDWRANEDSFTSDVLLATLPKLGKKYCFQLEKGATTGYRHWQGRISLYKRKRFPEIKALWEEEIGIFPNYFEPTTKTEFTKGDMFYQQKADTRLEGPWTDKMKPSYVRKRFRNCSLKDWQQRILDTSSKTGFEDRQINVLVQKKGNVGKSFLVDYCDDHNQGYEIPAIMNDGKEILQAVTNMLMATMEREPGIMFLDLPKAMNKERLNGMMTALETVKRGKVYDFRYKYTPHKFESPSIWVFTNMVPNDEWMSSDRWRFWKLRGPKDDKTLCRYTPDLMV